MIYTMMEDNKYIIYRIKNTITGKSYVGKHTTPNEFDSYFGSGIALKAAIKKYGKNKFLKEIVEFCENADHLSEREIFWISEFNSFVPNGYNIGIGGNGGDNFTNNPNREEIRRKMIANRKPRVASDEERERRSIRMTGSKLKPHEKMECEYCKSMISKANYNRWHGDYCKNNPNRTVKGLKKKMCIYCGSEKNPTEYSINHGDYCISNPNRKLNIKEKKECEHCSKYITIINYGLYHGENCKMNPLFNKNPELYKNTRAYDIINRINNKIVDRAMSEETKEKIRKSTKGIRPSEETIEKMRVSNKKKWDRLKENPAQYICEHCQNETSLKTNYIRWHGNNCKHK
jgi:hypothetical protein